jgi:membrane fusion protein, multidrug efflux system
MTVTGLEEVVDARSGTSVKRRRRVWPWLVGLAVVGAILTFRTVGARSAAAESAGKGRDARPVPVVTAAARTGDVPVYLRGLGTATAFNNATVKSRVDGQLVSVAAREGQLVREGEVLAQIDPRPFEVQIEQAEGQLARDRAALKDAQVILDRDLALFNEQIVAQQDLDSQRSKVGQFEGAIRSDEAQLHAARLQLSYSRITAPFSGRVGLRLVDPGNMVHANDAGGLLVLTQVHPIGVVFSLPQDDLGQVIAKLKSGPPLEVEAYDRDNSHQIATGKLLAIDNQIDSTTGTYKLKAVFDNENDALFPNQFVNVRLRLDTKRGLVLVPTAALQRGASNSFVYVVGSDLVAHVRPIEFVLNEGGDTGLGGGLEAGENVVVDGQDKLQEGSKVDLGTRGGGPGGKPGGGGKAGGGAPAEGGAKAKGRQP